MIYIGYTHYYYRNETKHDSGKFAAFVADVKKVLALVKKQGIAIAGGNGKGKPVVNDGLISFNGSEKGGEDHETLYIERDGVENFNFCKTARKPYDTAVVATLVLYKKHFPCVKFSSDGDKEEIRDGVELAAKVLDIEIAVDEGDKGFIFEYYNKDDDTPVVI